MAGISFCTPVEYGNQATSLGQKLTEFVDGYFYWGGRIAVVVPGAMRNGSQEVFIRNEEAPLWKTALKVLSYLTVILPIVFLIAKALLRSYYTFHTCQDQIAPTPRPDDSPYPIARAPLTLIRSPNAADLTVSVLYNALFRPQDPIVPAPTVIEEQGEIAKYTWNVHALGDGTMNVNDHRIHMVWWEAMRRGMQTPVDPASSICVSKNKIGDFLEAHLRKQGLEEGELTAFKNYWQTLLGREEAPYFLIQPIHASEQGQYIPEMQIRGEDADSFSLNRFYFRFEPVADSEIGMAAAVFLSGLGQSALGTHAVIDLGGEIVGELTAETDPTFNPAFIQRYIYAE